MLWLVLPGVPVAPPWRTSVRWNGAKRCEDIQWYTCLSNLNISQCVQLFNRILKAFELDAPNDVKFEIAHHHVFTLPVVKLHVFELSYYVYILRMQLNFKEIKKLNVLNMSPKIPDGSKLKLIRSNQPRSRILRPPVTTYEVQGPSATCQKSWHRFEAPRNT